MLIPDPCFIETIRRDSGSRRVLVHIANAWDQPRQLKLATVSKPEWVDLEQAMMGDTLSWKKRGKLPLVLNINTDHRYFPQEKTARESIRLEFESGESLTIYLTIQEITAGRTDFRGVFAIDFGTTNTCYAWKERVGEGLQIADLVKPPQASREIPTLLWYKDISNRALPVIDFGHTARDRIARNSGRSHSYVISVKRMMGQDRELVILDDRSGLEPDRYQRFRPEEIASHFIKDLLRDAEQRIGGRLTEIVATFPILYTRKKLAALRRAFRLAFEALGRPWSDDQLILRLDETNAAAFNYVYGQLLDEFRRFATQERQHRLLSYDFGGGTIDVSLLDVDLTRDLAGKIAVKTHMVGITGDRFFGGDIVTLAVVKLLKAKLAVKIAQVRIEQAARERQAADNAAAAQSQASNPWALGTSFAPAPAAAADDPWKSLAEPQPATTSIARPKEEEEENPETADIDNLTPPARTEHAWKVLADHADLVAEMCQIGQGAAVTIAKQVTDGRRKQSTLDQRELAQAIDDAIDTLIPTRWKTLEDAGDLIAKDTARKLFYELWLPAEVLKIRAVSEESRLATLTEPLHKIAKYAGIRPEDLMGITIAEAEIDAAIEPALRRSIGKAAQLLGSAGGSAPTASGLDFGGLVAASPSPGRPVTVLLAGNSARLPIVRRLVCEICQIDDHSVVMDPHGVKATVAQGACAEHLLRKDLGGGLIAYDAGDFTDRIPYSIGLFHKELALLGHAGGFATVLPRGTAVDTQLVLSEALQVVHAKATELSLFAYYHDHLLGLDPASAGPMAEVQPTTLGWFDLAKPEAEPWSGQFTQEIQVHLEALAGAFALVLVMDKNRELAAVRADGTTWHRLKASAESVPDAENPFGGVH
ncbi:hypothetical protein LBMAG53_10260 [Planctomycetota bacterium]|nr:hypothetical protein LBMAG53_10260 [Planctomycetota bacterium]